MKLGLSQILFLSAGVAVIVLLAFAGYIASIPSAAQYWSIDPEKAPEQAAEEAFAAGDYRFLGVRIQHEGEKESEFVYAIFRCADHPLGGVRPKDYAHFADIDGMDAWSSADSMRPFADAYNYRLWDLLEEHTDAKCSRYDVY